MKNRSLPVLKIFLLSIVVFLLLNNANAQWTSNGPNGITVNCLATSGSNIFAGTWSGMFISTNNGGNWTAVDTGLTDTVVISLAISDTNIFAGVAGVFLSTNNGGNWKEVGLPYIGVVSSFAINGSSIFAGGNGVALSTNNGGSWTALNNGLTTKRIVFSLATSDSNIFAGTDSGVYLSHNNGSNWTIVRLTNYWIHSLAISNSNIFAGTDGGVFLSTNNGGSWTTMNNGLTNRHVYSLVMSGSNIFAGTDSGVYLFHNNGSNWTGVGLTNLDINSLAISDSIIFAGTQEAGVWQRSLTNITGIQEIHIPAQNTFTLYPNPANNNFVVETNTTGKRELQVFDITGKLILTQTIYNNKTSIDASSLADGIYVARLIDNNGVQNDKLVIVR